jgi:hypothetical protein
MNASKKVLAMAATLSLAGAGALHAPTSAAPSVTGVALKCPAFCVTAGPIKGGNILPDGYGQISWSGGWTQVSTSNTTPTTPVQYLDLHASGVGNATSFTGSGFMWLYSYDYSGEGTGDNEYRTINVNVSITQGAVRINSAAGGVNIIGANQGGSFNGVGTRAQTG